MTEELLGEFREAFRPVLRELGGIERGERVRKLDAMPFDAAFNREGTVVVSGEYRAIHWDGIPRAFFYPSDTKLVLVADHDRIVAEFKARHQQ